MRIIKNSLVALLCCAGMCSSPILAQNNNDGYYKGYGAAADVAHGVAPGADLFHTLRGGNVG